MSGPITSLTGTLIILLFLLQALLLPSTLSMKIVLGQKSYSSWSLRGFLAIRHCTSDFDQVHVLVAGGFATEDQKAVARDLIAKYSPTGKVPVLLDPALGDDVPIYDSLAILIYLDGKYPEAKLLPEDGRARAQCLSAVCEMHSGFVGMRSNMPLNCVRRGYSHGARALAKPEVQADVQRLNELWGDLRGEYSASGQYLFGAFSAADCAFAPVALRFVTYDQDLSSLTPLARDYVRAIQRNAYVCEWIAGADAEGPETKIGGYEALCDAR